MKYWDNYWNYLLGKVSYKDYLINEGVSYKSIIPAVDRNYISMYKDTNLLPLYIDNGKLVVGYLEDIPYFSKSGNNEQLLRLATYDYKEIYNQYYGNCSFFKEIPLADYVQELKKFAIEKDAADITSYVVDDYIRIFINCPKLKESKIHCPIKIPLSKQSAFVVLMTDYDISTYTDTKPIYCDCALDLTHTGRCVINFTEKSKTAITIRIADNSVFNLTPDKLNLTPSVYDFITSTFSDRRGGLRVVIGKTSSGKNTTILSVLKQFIDSDKYKIVEIGYPIERVLPGVIQINCNSNELYKSNCQSLIRQNPDIVYPDEMTAGSSTDILDIADTDAKVISTIHANSNADLLVRLKSLTGRPFNDIIAVMHSSVYQRLVWDETLQKVVPRCRFVTYDKELKNKLYDKNIGEIVQIIQEAEGGDDITY